MTAAADDMIGNFRLLRPLGEGGMGVVYEAEHVTMHRRAAIKVLRSELVKDEQAIRRFFNEARATNEVRHPGIVQIYDCGTRADGSPWLIMELLEGETLGQRLARAGRLARAEVVELGAQAASVLAAAHVAGIVHRDLKPDNLFIISGQETPSGERVKVLDFGIAKLSSALHARSLHTQTGTLMGTPLYMSPEQCRGTAQIDARSDIYSLGLILYQMLAGELPFVSEGMGELFDMQMNRPAPPLLEKNPSVDGALAATVHRTLEKKPADRFQTMAELQHALLGAGAPAPAPSPSSASRSPFVMAAATGGGSIAPGAGARALPGTSTTLSASAMAISAADEPPAVRSRRPLAVAMIAGALAIAGAVVMATRSTARSPSGAGASASPSAPPIERREPSPAAAPAAAKPVTPAPAATPVPTPATEPAARAAEVVLEIKSVPAGAQVLDADDGHLIGATPLRHSFPRREGELRLRLEKEGYLPKSVAIPGRQDFKGSFKLERAGGRAPREPAEGERIIKL